MRKNVLREIFAEDFEEAESRGIKQGIEQGTRQGVENVAANMIRMKMPADDIKKATSISLSRLRELAKQIGMTLV